jgi:protein-tyrosine phosphatase
MIDIHSHILFGVDDGARSLDESLEMCRLSVADGVRVIVATPHAHDGVHAAYPNNFLHEKVEELNQRMEGELKVVLGRELRFTHDVVRHVCEEGSSHVIGCGPYALIEFPHAVVPAGSNRALFELMSRGFRPIIAHPERNQMLMAEPERFYEMVEAGALGQMDTGSITGQFGKKAEQTARVMLECGLIHFIASDCHNTRNRLPGLSMGVKAASSVVGEEYARVLAADNPSAVVEGTTKLVRPAAVRPRVKKRWLFFS